MENSIQNEPKKSNTGKIIGIVIGAFVVLACIIPVIVIAALAVMGPLVGNTFSSINSSLENNPAYATTLEADSPTLAEPDIDLPTATPNAIVTYPNAPAMSIDKNKQYFATVKMAKGGQFVIQLFPDKAPITVNNFVFLAREGFYNGVTFHRVLDGFMAQGGDPTGTGRGGPGYEFINEDSDLKFDKAGIVAMANAGRDSNGSQFFITFLATDYLNDGYTIFGQVIEGMDVVNSITRRDPDTNPTFTGDAMESVTITEK